MRALEILDARWTPAARAAPSSPTRCAGPARSRRSARRGKYLVWELSDDVYLLHAPAHDGHAAARPARRAPAHARPLRRSASHGSSSTTRAGSARASWRSGRKRWTRSSTPASASSRSRTSSPASTCTRSRARRARRSRRSCSTRSEIAGVGNIYADEALFRARIHPLRPANAHAAQATRCATRVVESLQAGIAAKGARSTTSATPTASRAPSRTSSSCTCARGCRARSCGGPSASCARRGAGPTSARSCQPRPRLRRELLEPAGAVGRDELLVAADRLAVDDDLGERHHARDTHQLRPAVRVLCEIDLLERDPALVQERLGDAADSRTARSCTW